MAMAPCADAPAKGATDAPRSRAGMCLMPLPFHGNLCAYHALGWIMDMAVYNLIATVRRLSLHSCACCNKQANMFAAESRVWAPPELDDAALRKKLSLMEDELKRMLRVVMFAILVGLSRLLLY